MGKLPKEWRWNVRGFKEVGFGRYGTVFKGSLRAKPDHEIIVKKIKVLDEDHSHVIRREIEISSQLGDRPGVVTFYRASDTEAIQPGDDVYIMMESASGTLNDMVVKKCFQEVPLSVRIRLFIEILQAVVDMNDYGVVHRDLNPKNILLVGDCTAEECSAVLCDMGSACSLPGGQWPAEDVAGSPSHMPPEAWEPGPSDLARDVWSLGVVLHQMIAGSLPTEVETATRTGDFKGAVTGFNIQDDPTWPLLQSVDPDMATMMSRMLDPNPATRISLGGALDLATAWAKKYHIDLSPRELPDTVHEWREEPPQGPLRAFRRSKTDDLGKPVLDSGSWRQVFSRGSFARAQELSDRAFDKTRAKLADWRAAWRQLKKRDVEEQAMEAAASALFAANLGAGAFHGMAMHSVDVPEAAQPESFGDGVGSTASSGTDPGVVAAAAVEAATGSSSSAAIPHDGAAADAGDDGSIERELRAWRDLAKDHMNSGMDAGYKSLEDLN